MIATLRQHATHPFEADLGPVALRRDLRSLEGPFGFFPEYRVIYPPVVIAALGELYLEYNQAFRPLIAANQEWDSDYRFCFAQDGSPINFTVQIDMVGLPERGLESLAGCSVAEVKDILRGMIFEFENSLAMYELLTNLFVGPGRESRFGARFRFALDALRNATGRKVLLVAVTDEKYEAMRSAEFGKRPGEPLSDAEVLDISGFDGFLGPSGLREFFEAPGSDALFYARTSDPVKKLRKPATVVEQPLLSDPRIRRELRARTITVNIDDPSVKPGDRRRVNDTKRYMPPMGMGFPLVREEDLYSSGLYAYLGRGRSFAEYAGPRFSEPCADFLSRCGVAEEAIKSGEVRIRCKPAQGTYGCYGHVSGTIASGGFRSELRRELKRRGDYVLQPELPIPTLVNSADGVGYAYIDRNFFAVVEGSPLFLGGVRNLLPLASTEAERGRIHGNEAAVWAEIV